MKSQESTAISTKYILLLALLSMIGTGIILWATNHYGAGISPDSIGYIATARHIADGVGVATYNNAPLVIQPPLYPAVLGFIDFMFGVDPLSSTNIVNAFLFGLTLYLSGLLFFKHLTSKAFALLGTASLLVSIPLIKVSLMAWSEPLFICFIVLYLVSLSNYLEKINIRSLLLLSLAVTLACLTRYIGVALILTGMLSILLIRQSSLKAKTLHLLIFAFVSILPLSIWVTRNYILSNTLFGPRAPSTHTLIENLSFTFETLLLWYLPWAITHSLPILTLIGMIIILWTSLFFLGAKTPVIKLLKQIRPLFVFTFLVNIGYTGFLVISSTTTAYDRIEDRLLSPIVVPVTLLLLYIIEILTKPVKMHFATKSVNPLILAGIAYCFLVYPAKISALNITNQLNEGSGFGAKSWRNSQTIQYIIENPSNCTVYSNGDDVIYLLAFLSVKPIPAKSSGANLIADIPSLKDTWPQENQACIAWFNQITWRTYLFTPDELLSIANLEQVIQLDDGKIFFVSRK